MLLGLLLCGAQGPKPYTLNEAEVFYFARPTGVGVMHEPDEADKRDSRERWEVIFLREEIKKERRHVSTKR